MIYAIIALSIISGVLYRMGGSGRFPRQARIIGCSLVTMIALLLLCGFSLMSWWAYLLTFGLSCAAVSAYWGQDEKPWGYWAHGLGLALALLPMAFATGNYIGFGIRGLLVTAGICLWSQFTKWDILEEFGRGFIIIITLLVLLLTR